MILMIQENSENQNTAQNLSPEITLINADKDDLQCEEKCEELLYALRARNIYADFDLRGKNLKAQFKRANKLNSKFALVIGGDEIKTQSGKLRNLETGAEQQVALSVDELVQKL